MLEADVHAYLRSMAGPTACRVGPFTVRFDEHDDALPFNYAIPDDDSAPMADEVAELVAAFRERGRTPRLEYVPAAAPKVESALLAAGFTAEGRFPLLVCSPDEVVDSVMADDAIRVALVSDDPGLWRVARVMNEAFQAPEATEHDVARLRGVLDRGGLVAAAVDTTTGDVVGGGQIGSPHRGVAEVAGIAVLSSQRRRGIGGAITAFLTRAAASAGITTPFLTPADDRAAQIYARVGYRKLGEALFLSLR
ncbi:acetyltransferase (GNAT) family protein [Nonomuraea polychroma]|uniref:Acetyltransferase (GNAT) family protein n=1 Tax=Nonomuraea polychroma TaxID=46176 RepID=A0A438ML39_9ACTN|nr:GNAT family N-acetyltransferase [Nonomuraea polychroma]RVX46315.1 acetyltransferase (GNAT) family protein [Nonomuraea polychroma]